MPGLKKPFHEFCFRYEIVNAVEIMIHPGFAYFASTYLYGVKNQTKYGARIHGSADACP